MIFLFELWFSSMCLVTFLYSNAFIFLENIYHISFDLLINHIQSTDR
jgi:hypothetical protein